MEKKTQTAGLVVYLDGTIQIHPDMRVGDMLELIRRLQAQLNSTRMVPESPADVPSMGTDTS